MYRGRKVIVTVFAGRKDRMTLLLNALDALIKQQKLVDEVHLWDYCRTEEDRAWLRSLPSTLHFTDDEYAYSDSAIVSNGVYDVTVTGPTNDIHVLLTTSEGTEYELILGGWDNTRSAIRKGRQTTPFAQTDAVRLSGSTTQLSLRWGDGSMHVTVNGGEPWVFPFDAPPTATIAHSTGWGNTGVYDFADNTTTYRYCKPTRKWHSYYDHYAALSASRYADTILIKLDDDIVHISTDTFASFLDFRIDHPEFSLVFPNVVNNGTCAYVQQKYGLLRGLELDEEMPGVCGKLWESPANAAAVHAEYLIDPTAFQLPGEFTKIRPHLRVSINAFAVLSESLSELFRQAGGDDESFLTEIHPGTKAVFHGTTVAHLSFYSQESGLDIPGLLAQYAALPLASSKPKSKPRPRPKKPEPSAAEPATQPVVEEVLVEVPAEPAAEPAAEPVVEVPAAEVPVVPPPKPKRTRKPRDPKNTLVI
jgi:hypothetical protein